MKQLYTTKELQVLDGTSTAVYQNARIVIEQTIETVYVHIYTH
jgi:hypothetical protein